MGTYFLVESIIDLTTESIGAYLVFLIPSSLAAKEFNKVAFLVGVSNLFLVINALLR